MIGEKLGKFTILETIGSGTMGTVYKAEDPADGSRVAIKLVKSQILTDPEKRERFLQGLLAGSEIKHPAICPILEIGDDNDDFFVVMPLLDGETLSKRIARGPLPWKKALEMALPVAEALAAGHAAGATHRGLKPANVWLRKDGGVLLTDFGLARFTEIERRRRTPACQSKTEFADMVIPMAALGHMSPEQVRGGRVDHRTDIFSFGAMLYEMLTGVHPYEARNSLSRMHAIVEGHPPPVGTRGIPLPPELNSILDRALAKSPSDRYQRMEELLAALRNVEKHGEAPVPAVKGDAASRADVSRSRARYFIIALLLALIAAAYLLWRRSM